MCVARTEDSLLIDGGLLTEGPLSQGVSPKTPYGQRGHNLYLPIPYAKHCKITSDNGDFYYHVRDYDSAEVQLLHTLEMNSTFTFTHAYLGLVYLQKGMCEKALKELQNEIGFAIGTEDIALAWKGYAYGICGLRQKGYEVLNQLIECSQTRHIPPTYLAN